MHGGFRTYVPVAIDLDDDLLIERTQAFRSVFNRYYRLRPDAQAAERYAQRQTSTGRFGSLVTAETWPAGEPA